MKDKFSLKGFFSVEHRNKNNELVGIYRIPNGIVNEGLNHILDTEFHATAQIATWYIGLVDNAGWTGWNDADVMAAHAGWAESVAYTEGTRVEWTEGAAAARAITNAVTCDFSINAAGVMKGIFIVSDNTKGGAIGVLWSTAAFTSVVNVNNGDTFKITYTVSG